MTFKSTLMPDCLGIININFIFDFILSIYSNTPTIPVIENRMVIFVFLVFQRIKLEHSYPNNRDFQYNFYRTHTKFVYFNVNNRIFFVCWKKLHWIPRFIIMISGNLIYLQFDRSQVYLMDPCNNSQQRIFQKCKWKHNYRKRKRY